MRRYKPKTIPLADDALSNDSYCFRKHKAHQVGQILSNPETSLEKIHLISDDLFTPASSHHIHCDDSIDLWKIEPDSRTISNFTPPVSKPGIGRPNEVFLALLEHYDTLPEYTVALMLHMMIKNPNDIEKLGVTAYMFIWRLFRQKGMNAETIEESVDWIQEKMRNMELRYKDPKYFFNTSSIDDNLGMSYDGYARMLLELARNSKCPAHLIERFCGSSLPELREFAFNSPLCSEEGKIVYTLMENG